MGNAEVGRAMNDQRQQSAGTERLTETQGPAPSADAAPRNDPVAAPGRKGRAPREPVTTLSDYFVWESAQQRLRDNPRYLSADLAGTDPTHRLHETARALEPGLHEAKRRVESLNLLMATALWLHHTEGLEVDVITEELVAAVRDIP